MFRTGVLRFPHHPAGHLSLLPSPPFTCPPEARALFLPKTKPHIPQPYHPDLTLPGFLTLGVLISYLLLLVEPPGLKGKTGHQGRDKHATRNLLTGTLPGGPVAKTPCSMQGA